MELVNIIDNNINDVKSLGEMALENATTAKNDAKSTGDKAEALERVANIPLENVDVNGTKGIVGLKIFIAASWYCTRYHSDPITEGIKTLPG